jgi:23S rRNA (uracil1939-C5)-methyltransferase
MLDCPHAEVCPGCPLLALPLPEQLQRKHQRLSLAFAPFHELASATIEPVVPASPVEAYRTRAKWVVGPDGALGLFAPGSDHQVLDLPGCRVLAPPLLRVAQLVRDALAAPGWLRDHLRAIDLREIHTPRRSGVLLTLVVPLQNPPPLDDARRAAQALASPELLAVALNLVRPGAPQILGPQTIPLLGPSLFEDSLGSTRVLATFGAFVQAHRGQATALQQAIADEARGPVLELYGGSGFLGLAIAARGVPVDSVEAFEPASRAAGEAASRARVPLRALTGDAAEVLRALLRERRAYDLVVANPPRRGLPPPVREALAALGPRAIAYMSCEPRTLARDLAHLARLGYAPLRVRPHDMMPQTGEVETLVLLERRPPAAPRLLGEGEAWFCFEKPPHEAVGSLQARVRGLPGLGGVTALSRLDRDVSGPCFFLREGAPAGQTARTRWRAWVRGVTHRTGALGDGARYRRIKARGGHSELDLDLPEGALGAVRKRLAALGHPVLGDARFGHEPTNRYFYETSGLDRPCLHGVSGAIEGVVEGVPCPWPADLILPDGPEPAKVSVRP